MSAYAQRVVDNENQLEEEGGREREKNKHSKCNSDNQLADFRSGLRKGLDGQFVDPFPLKVIIIINKCC